MLSDSPPSTDTESIRVTIEVCIDSVESAIAAIKGGANRLELCGNLGLGGGTTPSLGLFRQIRKACPDTPIMVMIRPRTGDFLYSDYELSIMSEDILIFKEAGAEGVVFGVLTAEGLVDKERTERLVDDAAPMQGKLGTWRDFEVVSGFTTSPDDDESRPVCFHRAFDMTRESPEVTETSLQKLTSIPGITRVLTSGHGRTAPSSLQTLKVLFQEVKRHNAHRSSPLVILPASGINPRTVSPLLKELHPLGLQEVHLSAGSWVPSEMSYRPEGMGMGVGGDGEWSIWRTSEDVVRSVRQMVDSVSSLEV